MRLALGWGAAIATIAGAVAIGMMALFRPVKELPTLQAPTPSNS